MLFHSFDRETFLEFEVEQMHEHEFHQSLHTILIMTNISYIHFTYLYMYKKRKMKVFKTYLEIGAKPVAIPYLQGCILVR